MDISKDGPENAILLAISSVLQGTLSVGQLSELLSKIILDIEPDGTVETNATSVAIYNNAFSLQLASVRNNMNIRYSALGIQYPIPPFELYAKRLIPLSVIRTIPKNSESQVRFDLDKIAVYFNKELNQNSVNGSNS